MIFHSYVNVETRGYDGMMEPTVVKKRWTTMKDTGFTHSQCWFKMVWLDLNLSNMKKKGGLRGLPFKLLISLDRLHKSNVSGTAESGGRNPWEKIWRCTAFADLFAQDLKRRSSCNIIFLSRLNSQHSFAAFPLIFPRTLVTSWRAWSVGMGCADGCETPTVYTFNSRLVQLRLNDCQFKVRSCCFYLAIIMC